MNKRILIVRRYKGFGGIEHQIETLSNGLIKRGWKVFLLTNVASPFSLSMQSENVKVIVAPFGSLIHTAHIIAEICRNENIEIIQAHMLNEDYRCRIAKLCMPQLKHVFRVHTYIDCSNISNKKKNIYHLTSKLTDFLVDRYISINRFNVNEMVGRTKINEKKISIVHDAVRDFGGINNTVAFRYFYHVAMIANFDPGKGHEVAIEAINILKEEGLELVLHLIGGMPGQGTEFEDSTIYDKCKRMVNKYGLESQIIFEGYCTDIEDRTRNCDAIILPSESEGTPNCLLEGMILNKVVVASNVGGVPEFIINGRTGFSYHPNTSKKLAETIKLMYSKEAKELQSIMVEAKKIVISEYSEQQVISGMVKEYSKL